MLNIFRKNIYLQIVLLLAIAALLWFRIFLHPLPTPDFGGGQLYYLLTDHLPPIISAILALLLIVLEGVLISTMMYRHKLISQGTLMPLLFYMLAMSVVSPTLTPILLGNLFIILAISQMMVTSTLLSINIDKTFGAAACISLATLVCPTMIVFLIPMIFNMFNYSLYSLRDWTMVLLGLLAPYILLETIYFVNDEMFYRNYLLYYTLSDLNLKVGGNTMDWVGSGCFLMLLVAGLLHLAASSQNNTVNYKTNSAAVVMFLLGSLAMVPYTQAFPIMTQAFAIPFCFTSTILFLDSKRKEAFWNIILFAIIVIFILWNIL